jgi:hypothetical protein
MKKDFKFQGSASCYFSLSLSFDLMQEPREVLTGQAIGLESHI